MALQAFFAENPKVAVAFSGGVDSAYLLYAAKKWGTEICAYYAKTPFQPQFELDDAMRLAKFLDVPVKVISVDILADPVIAANPENRCYFCKKRLFTTILQQAKQDGFPLVVDGTNFSDNASDRPGMQALQELGIRSPLREAKLTKEAIRRLSKEAGLFTHDKPAYACLATRFPKNIPITEAALARVERSEDYLQSLGFSDFRMRLTENGAKLQLREEDFPRLLQHREEILKKLKQDHSNVLLDLEVRK